MRKKCLVLVALLSLGLSGCGSDAKYKELEERVAQLEKMVGVNSNNATTQESSISSVQSSEEVADVPDPNVGAYLIDDLSAQEIISECQYYFDNIPTPGSSYDEYFSTLKVTPSSEYLSEASVQCNFLNESSESGVLLDRINYLIVSGIQTEMDGNIGYSDNRISVTIIMTVHNYEKAVSIYNGLYDVVVNEYVRDVNEDKKGTNWMVTGIENSGNVRNLLSMSRDDNGYRINATYHIDFG